MTRLDEIKRRIKESKRKGLDGIVGRVELASHGLDDLPALVKVVEAAKRVHDLTRPQWGHNVWIDGAGEFGDLANVLAEFEKGETK